MIVSNRKLNSAAGALASRRTHSRARGGLCVIRFHHSGSGFTDNDNDDDSDRIIASDAGIDLMLFALVF